MSQEYIEEENIPKSCQQIAHYSDKLQYGEASFWEKLKLKIHISYCERCRKYNAKNGLLTNLFKKKDYEVLDVKDLEEIKQKVNSNN
ncbi:hypothetical protein [Psychroflexus sp. MBR-150]|jgi:hypothetical protein